jgi:hypothetical protein
MGYMKNKKITFPPPERYMNTIHSLKDTRYNTPEYWIIRFNLEMVFLKKPTKNKIKRELNKIIDRDYAYEK